MPYTTLVAGTVITASWANACVRDQGVTPFADASARTSAITSPVEGMLTYLTGSDQLHFYSGSVWVPVPGTLIARGYRTSSSSSTTSEIGVMRLPVGTLVNGKVYRIMTGNLDFYSTAANDVIISRIRYTTDGSTPSTSSTILMSQQHTAIGAGTDEQYTMCGDYFAGASDNLTLLLTIGRSAGSGTIQMLASSTMPIQYSVICLGSDPGDTGVDI